MGFLRHLVREYMLHRLLSDRRHRRHGFWGGSQRPVSLFPPPRRHRRRSNVRVSGCCLPIPIGVLATFAAAAKLTARRRR